jgi:thiamine pyrophosphate-dependent acetolactate synthase large subunit-like protein
MKKCKQTTITLSVRTTIVIPVRTDSAYGLIKRHPLHRYGCESHITFNNSDLVMHDRSCGAGS